MAHSSAPPLKNTGMECLGGGAGPAPYVCQVHQAVRPVARKWFSVPGETLYMVDGVNIRGHAQ